MEIQNTHIDTAASASRLALGVARTQEEVREVQRLRYKIFFESAGLALPGRLQFRVARRDRSSSIFADGTAGPLWTHIGAASIEPRDGLPRFCRQGDDPDPVVVTIAHRPLLIAAQTAQPATSLEYEMKPCCRHPISHRRQGVLGSMCCTFFSYPFRSTGKARKTFNEGA